MNTRVRGLFIFLGCAAIFAGFARGSMYLTARNEMPQDPYLLLTLAVPGGYALVGLLEAITGVPFLAFARRWDALAGWQRGVFGTLIVIAAAAVILLAVMVFVIR